MKKTKSLSLHLKLKGKLEIKSKLRIRNRNILSEIYTPGVSDAVRAIAANKNRLKSLTIQGNTVAVITDGSAVLGLGNIGPEAALPVMEGKCAIFKEFADLNAFPVCLKTQNTNEIISTIEFISPVFAAINLEDITAPKCFEIEEKLQDLGIPVVHDDQHATAIIVLAGLINATKIARKKLKECKIVVCGTGAAGSAIIKLLYFFGCRNLIATDSKGIIEGSKKDLSAYKKEIAEITNIEKITGLLEDAVFNADILVGVSKKDLFGKQMIKSMSIKPIIFALANPEPEISRHDAQKAGAFIYASGRSDDKNQINNALVFPGFFKGLIETHKTKVTDNMKIKAAYSIANLIKHPTLTRFIPDIFDRRLVKVVAESLRD